MPERDNERKNRSIIEENETSVDKNSTREKSVMEALDELDFNALEKKYTTSVSAKAIAEAEKAIREQAIRDKEIEALEKQQKYETEAIGRTAKFKEAEARIKAEELAERRKLQEAIAEAHRRQMTETEGLEDVASRIEEERRRNEAKLEEELRRQEEIIDQERKAREAELIEAKRKEEIKAAQEAKKKAKIEAARAKKEAKEKAEAERRAAKIEAEKQRKEAERQRREAKAKAEQQRRESKAKAEAEKKAIRQAQEQKRKESKTAEEKRKEAERAEKRKRKEERDLLIAEQRAIQKEKRAKEKLERKELARKRIAERQAINQARKGGGVVQVHDTEIETTIKDFARHPLKALLGFSNRKEIKAAETEEEKRQLIIENEQIKTAARQEAIENAELRMQAIRGSKLGTRMHTAVEYCEQKKKPILIGLGIVLMVVTVGIGILNYYTAYEYSYNGTSLGYVKDKDDVLQITQMVQDALTEDKDMEVIVDAQKDISFDRVLLVNKDITIDSADDVLKRMTYMGDLNVKAYGIYINGKKVGAVKDKDTAAEVMSDIVDRYASNEEGSEIENFSFVENVTFKTSNTDLRDVLSKDEMVEKLCTSGERTVSHTVVEGDTLANLARDHGVTEEQLLEDNPGINKKKLEVGSAIVINEEAPLMQIKITEVRNYEKKTAYKTVKKKDDSIYEGTTEVTQEGKKGLSEISERTVSVNGEVVETVNLKNEVKEEPVDKIVKVGTKELPPTVGTGTYIWPAYSGTYTVTSEFKWRWGRQHQGIDLGCAVGTDVLAADGGTVEYAGYMGGYGNLVIIDHENGIKTYYGHNTSLLVSEGDKVFQGQHIAEAGSTGNSTGPHIHFGVLDNGTFYNPRNYLP